MLQLRKRQHSQRNLINLELNTIQINLSEHRLFAEKVILLPNNALLKKCLSCYRILWYLELIANSVINKFPNITYSLTRSALIPASFPPAFITTFSRSLGLSSTSTFTPFVTFFTEILSFRSLTFNSSTSPSAMRS